ncbi:hypothetical protein TEA_023423 [Camellia sinensis var. sinensis]|uniref:Uncharacterized protein n=1 Tax=Camellia sinensis var. sinensis TaxID=542762 RepID=A0A4S4CWL3_CAMSN|nr:hypothetical protein TEA_023423 [Camellia sinensis var. sinensis]
MLILSHIANNLHKAHDDLPPDGIVAAVLVVFSILGITLAITYSVPYALISSHVESLGLGQGLSMGVLNVAIVIPQLISASFVSVYEMEDSSCNTSIVLRSLVLCYASNKGSLFLGPWDQLFGAGNSPSLAVAAVAAFTSGLIAILAIPRAGADKSRGQ